MEYIEFNTQAEGVVLMLMKNITMVMKNPPSYPKFETTYSVVVNSRNFTLSAEEGETVYAQYKEWLTRAIKS